MSCGYRATEWICFYFSLTYFDSSPGQFECSGVSHFLILIHQSLMPNSHRVSHILFNQTSMQSSITFGLDQSCQFLRDERTILSYLFHWLVALINSDFAIAEFYQRESYSGGVDWGLCAKMLSMLINSTGRLLFWRQNCCQLAFFSSLRVKWVLVHRALQEAQKRILHFGRWLNDIKCSLLCTNEAIIDNRFTLNLSFEEAAFDRAKSHRNKGEF